MPEQVLGFKQTDTMMLIFLVNIAAALGAFAFGYAQDRMGLKSALGVTPRRLDRDDAARGVRHLGAAVLGGGDRRAVHGFEPVGRARAGGDLRPRAQVAEFFGLWTFAVRLAAIVGTGDLRPSSRWSPKATIGWRSSTGAFFVGPRCSLRSTWRAGPACRRPRAESVPRFLR